MNFDFHEILKSGKHIGKLSTNDVKELTKFIQNFKERLEAYRKPILHSGLRNCLVTKNNNR